MKDTEIRGILLQFYYENRRKPLTRPNPEDFGGTLTDDEILEVSDQLARHQLLDWKPLRAQNRIINGMGKISPFGIDGIEGTARADITIELAQNKNITITGSSNVIIGDNNSQHLTQAVRDLVNAINSSGTNLQQKEEAKGLLQKFVEHPLVNTLVGAAAGLIK